MGCALSKADALMENPGERISTTASSPELLQPFSKWQIQQGAEPGNHFCTSITELGMVFKLYSLGIWKAVGSFPKILLKSWNESCSSRNFLRAQSQVDFPLQEQKQTVLKGKLLFCGWFVQIH